MTTLDELRQRCNTHDAAQDDRLTRLRLRAAPSCPEALPPAPEAHAEPPRAMLDAIRDYRDGSLPDTFVRSRGQGITVGKGMVSDRRAEQARRAERSERIRTLAAQGKSRRQIAELTGVAVSTVNKTLRVPNPPPL